MTSPLTSLGTSAGTHATSACRRTPSAYEANVARFGPVAASAIGVAQAAAPAASAVVSFSEKAMKELAAVAPAVADALGAVGDGLGAVADGVEAVWDQGAELVDDVEDAASAVWNQGVALVDSVENAADAAANVVGDATDAVVDAVKTAAGNVAGYALLGAASVAGLIDTVV